MTDLLQKAIAYAKALAPDEQDQIAKTIFTELNLAAIRAQLMEADADFLAGRFEEESEAFWAVRMDRAQETIVF